jgi:hypothetical protein
MAPTRRTARVAVALAALVLPVMAGAMEVKMFAIGDFVPGGSGGCGGNDIGHWPTMVEAWYDHMWLFHGHTADGNYSDGNMTVTRFCDPDWNGGCQDYLYLDEADAAMIGFHGSDAGDHWAGTMRYPALGGNCQIDGGGSSPEIAVGDVDLEFFHASSCYSADDDNLSGIRFALTDPVDGGHAHQWDGFHGIMWIGSGLDGDYVDFAHDAHSVSISHSWVTNHYHNDSMDCEWYDPFNWFGTCDDQCPIGYSIGSSASDALTRLNNERYNNVYSDPSSHSWYAYEYYASCDPVGETAFAP